MRAAPAPPIRAANAAELPAAITMLRRAGFHANVGRLLEYPAHSPHGCVLVAPGRGVACCAAFATTGWIGALGVVPEARRRGLGTALTEAAVDWLRDRGAQTVLLYATDGGRPVYERLGFVTEGVATAWRGTPGKAPVVPLRRLHEHDRATISTLDRAVTGEDRAAVIDAARPLAGFIVEDGGGGVRGFALSSPWGAGAAVCATDDDAGVALLAAAARASADGAVIVPDPNASARAAVHSWRLARLNDAQRMCLGPAVEWRPEQQFGLFNLFWG